MATHLRPPSHGSGGTRNGFAYVTFSTPQSLKGMATLLHDLRYAFRLLRRSPLFASVAVLSLALGIGANAAIFALINQLILQPLPVKHPEELVLLTARGNHYGSNSGSNAISYPMYQDFRDENQVFSGMFCRHGETVSLNFDGRTEMVLA